jgi:hypothetical protein
VRVPESFPRERVVLGELHLLRCRLDGVLDQISVLPRQRELDEEGWPPGGPSQASDVGTCCHPPCALASHHKALLADEIASFTAALTIGVTRKAGRRTRS